jgi:hypothetical protein
VHEPVVAGRDGGGESISDEWLRTIIPVGMFEVLDAATQVRLAEAQELAAPGSGGVPEASLLIRRSDLPAVVGLAAGCTSGILGTAASLDIIRGCFSGTTWSLATRTVVKGSLRGNLPL